MKRNMFDSMSIDGHESESAEKQEYHEEIDKTKCVFCHPDRIQWSSQNGKNKYKTGLIFTIVFLCCLTRNTYSFSLHPQHHRQKTRPLHNIGIPNQEYSISVLQMRGDDGNSCYNSLLHEQKSQEKACSNSRFNINSNTIPNCKDRTQAVNLSTRRSFHRTSNNALLMAKDDLSSFEEVNNGWSRSVTVSHNYNRNAEGSNPNSATSTTTMKRSGKSSQFGVRSRVRSVLEKARNRTGIRNNNSEKNLTPRQKREQEEQRRRQSNPPSTQSVIAEAASIGGLGAVVVDEMGTVDVALELEPTFLKNTNGAEISKTRNGTETSPASTYSPPSVEIEQGPEDCLRTSSTSNTMNAKAKSPKSDTTTTISKPITVRDAFTGDVSAAFSVPPSPLPFTLPKLSAEQLRQVNAGERVQFQSDMGRQGSGFVVVDVKAPPDAVWDCLLDFQSYPQTIPTVRTVEMTSKDVSVLKHGVPSVTRASFSLSKFRLQIAAIHKYRPHPQGDYMVFTLDPACTNLVLKSAKGVWHTQENVDGRKGITRVWLLCELKVSNILPKFIVDYAAKKAMPRATTWLKPQVEAAASLWLREDLEKDTQ